MTESTFSNKISDFAAEFMDEFIDRNGRLTDDERRELEGLIDILEKMKKIAKMNKEYDYWVELRKES